MTFECQSALKEKVVADRRVNVRNRLENYGQNISLNRNKRRISTPQSLLLFSLWRRRQHGRVSNTGDLLYTERPLGFFFCSVSMAALFMFLLYREKRKKGPIENQRAVLCAFYGPLLSFFFLILIICFKLAGHSSHFSSLTYNR